MIRLDCPMDVASGRSLVEEIAQDAPLSGETTLGGPGLPLRARDSIVTVSVSNVEGSLHHIGDPRRGENLLKRCHIILDGLHAALRHGVTGRVGAGIAQDGKGAVQQPA